MDTYATWLEKNAKLQNNETAAWWVRTNHFMQHAFLTNFDNCVDKIQVVC